MATPEKIGIPRCSVSVVMAAKRETVNFVLFLCLDLMTLRLLAADPVVNSLVCLLIQHELLT